MGLSPLKPRGKKRSFFEKAKERKEGSKSSSLLFWGDHRRRGRQERRITACLDEIDAKKRQGDATKRQELIPTRKNAIL